MAQGKGLFSTLSGYVAARGKQAAYGLGATALGAYGRTAQGALWGAAAGGIYGGGSSDTSIIGGMAMGASIGAVWRGAPISNRGLGLRGAAEAARNLAMRDARGVKLAANRGYGKIRSSMKGWTRGLSPVM